MAQQKLFEAEAEVEARNCEKRKSSDIAFHEINQEFESQPFQLHQARDCQEIEDLTGICCEETDRARQARTDEFSMHQARNPTTVSQLMTQIRKFQNKVNSVSDARDSLRS